MKYRKFVICVENTDYPASLEVRKVYESLPDADAESHGQIRIVDESGDDYLYPTSYFVEISLPKDIEEAIVHAA